MGGYTTHMTLVVQYIKGCVFRRWEGYIKTEEIPCGGAGQRERAI